ncbi:MAG TPA: hypothetical protein VK670_05425 [Silvibacterium sp.]|nr:hypothetical protein [Silvibacterium sp.]
MNRPLIWLWALFAVVILIAASRLYAIYRRRRRWKLLTTSHHSLHIARERIARPPLPEEE